MSMGKTSHEKLEIGMTVEINPRSDRSRQKIVKGIVSEILTKSADHPHGILVNLKTGETGRVKRIVGAKDIENEESNSFSNSKRQSVSLKECIKKGENHHVEFKKDALWSSHFTSEDIKNHRPQTKELHEYGKATSKVIIAKTIAGFLNSDGGVLVIGIKENKDGEADNIIGIEPEYKLLKDPCQDGYRRMLVDLIKDHFPSNFFNHLNRYFSINFENVGGHTVCGLSVSKSDKRAFLKLNGKDRFYIRTDASTRELTGEEVVEYCQSRFS